MLLTILTEEPLAYLPRLNNWVFLLFLFCFLIMVRLFSDGARTLSLIFELVFRSKERQNLFSTSVDHELLIKFLLVLQTTLLLSILIPCAYLHNTDDALVLFDRFLWMVGLVFLLLLVFALYKCLAYFIVGKLFFPQGSLRQWTEYLLSVLSLLGVVLFLPVLLVFFLPSLYPFLIYVCLLALIAAFILSINRAIRLFFNNKILSLGFILYLCAQEMIPLYFLYRGLFYLLSFVQKDTLWLQM